ncbi:hypothetical protein [Thiosulfatihalobacter marinus]|nr:hypothetical protein [Thiosulfatihalobacter marinus]
MTQNMRLVALVVAISLGMVVSADAQDHPATCDAPVAQCAAP